MNFWKRDVNNVLDTTQLANTPIFAVFNNTIGIAKGVEARVDATYKLSLIHISFEGTRISR